MQLATVLVLIALALAVVGIVAALRQRAVVASVLIVGGLVLGLTSGASLD
ncbi:MULTISPECIES: hypothetical protein [unclassified Kribbella]